MPYTLNAKLSGLKPYDPIEGAYAVRLDANESFIDAGPRLAKSIARVLAGIALNRYPDPYATQAVQAFSQLYGVPGEWVTAGNGSDELISVITGCFLQKGDRLLTLTPDFSMYAFYGGLCELDVRTMQKREDLSIDVDAVIDTCRSENIQALIFSNPCNPTSLGLDREQALRLIRGVSCLVIVDEAYMDFWDQSVLDCVREYDHVIVLKTCSKAIGLAAIRLGFAVAGPAITRALRAAKSPYNTDAVSQAVGACALREKKLLWEARDRIVRSRKDLYRQLCALAQQYPALERVYPSQTNFVLVKTRQAARLHAGLLERGIAVRRFEGFLRITAGGEQENAQFLTGLNALLAVKGEG